MPAAGENFQWSPFGAEPHEDEARELRAADRGVVAGEGQLAIEPVPEQRTGDATQDVRELDGHAPVAEEDHDAPVDQPLHAADQQVMACVSAERHSGGGTREGWGDAS